ncbi:MAG: hypothetical protein Q9225_007927, partial [Loekoesia sp. 1 TL-2023]
MSAVSAGKMFVHGVGGVLPTDRMQQDGFSGKTMLQVVNGGISLIAYKTNDLTGKSLGEWLRIHVVRSRIGLYYVLTLPFVMLFPSGYLAFAMVPLIQSTLFKAYIPFPFANDMLNLTLNKHGYSFVARQESNTGYISVLDNSRDGFRVMRCDHSLLGGEWLEQGGQAPGLREPVYAIFVMLEAVRLVQPKAGTVRAQDDQESALVIGLGIGTTPSALVAHRIDTTVVEIDPVVHAFATQHFNLPSNHTSVIQDAVVFVEQNRNNRKYDYIIHDVFTGGAEPIELFTVEFLEGLKDILKHKGTIAI